MIRYNQPNLNLNINHGKHKFNLKRPKLNKVVKFNNLSPLYLFELSEENRAYALLLKKAAIKLNASLDQCLGNEEHSVFHLKKAFSSNDKIAHVDIIGNDYDALPKPFTLKVHSLAGTQINSGYEIPANNRSLSIGIYSFSITIEDTIHELQFDVPEKRTNKENLVKLVNLINQFDLGIIASYRENPKAETIQAILETEDTGALDSLSFTIQDIKSESNYRGIIEYFGLNNVTQYPKNSTFEINGVEKNSVSNCFIYNSSIKISLNSPSLEEINVTYTLDGEKIVESFSMIVKEYNYLMDLVSSQGKSQKASELLKIELYHIYKDYMDELEDCGFSIDDAGMFQLDPSLSFNAAREGIMKNLLRKDGYIDALYSKMNQIMSDPMIYLDKKVVTYPNTSTPVYYNPYILSLYSGMIYNFYC